MNLTVRLAAILLLVIGVLLFFDSSLAVLFRLIDGKTIAMPSSAIYFFALLLYVYAYRKLWVSDKPNIKEN